VLKVRLHLEGLQSRCHGGAVRVQTYPCTLTGVTEADILALVVRAAHGRQTWTGKHTRASPADHGPPSLRGSCGLLGGDITKHRVCVGEYRAPGLLGADAAASIGCSASSPDHSTVDATTHDAGPTGPWVHAATLGRRGPRGTGAREW
jgi:hypothetical protein